MTSQSFDNNGLRQKLRGLWFLESFIDVLGDGSVVHMMGEGATGYIQYTDDNWMTVQIMGSDRVTVLLVKSSNQLPPHDFYHRAAAYA
ncbi:lipocalin-like domain-containing protein, partial [Pectobacterium brasiliense]|uniref:lipocalin-like domain-containing protein n=1 Tax=Pectobacterium brasiliense TaxID=180957 RepID=UPI0020C0CDC1